jgi:hypothetical protein
VDDVCSSGVERLHTTTRTLLTPNSPIEHILDYNTQFISSIEIKCLEDTANTVNTEQNMSEEQDIIYLEISIKRKENEQIRIQ